MPKFLRTALRAFASLVLLFVGVGVFMPRYANLSRSVEIDAPADDVWPLLIDLELNALWDPWMAADATVARTYSDPPRGVGAWYEWTSELSASGRYVIVAAEENERVDAVVTFEGMGDAETSLAIERVEDGVRVTWSFRDDAGFNLFARWMNVLFLGRFVGTFYEAGLGRMQELAENADVWRPAPAQPEASGSPAAVAAPAAPDASAAATAEGSAAEEGSATAEGSGAP